jgi:hypothetical protein
MQFIVTQAIIPGKFTWQVWFGSDLEGESDEPLASMEDAAAQAIRCIKTHWRFA